MHTRNLIGALVFITVLIVGKPYDSTQKKISDFENELNILVDYLDNCKWLSLQLSDIYKPKIVGFDFAGYEDYFNEDIRSGYFRMIVTTSSKIKRIFGKGLFNTVHCGETRRRKKGLDESTLLQTWNDDIFDIIFWLHPIRLGHALNITDPNLYCMIHSKGMTIELCPSSNCQVSSFNRTPWLKTQPTRDYPIKIYYDNLLKITINTDNPAISRTDWTRELLLASELYEGYLSLEQIIEFIYNGVTSSFLSPSERKILVDIFEKEIIRVLSDYVSQIKVTSRISSRK